VAAWWLGSGPLRIDGPIILISIDTLRADRLPVYGYTKIPTPNIDALAADGIAFERAYAHAPQTLPSHASILSGRLPFEHGVRDNVGFQVRQGERLLPSLLAPRGYKSGGVVSAYVLRKDTRIDQGFDFFDSQLPPASPEASIGQVQREGLASLAVAERWLDSRASDRVFLLLHLYEPHKPYTPPSRFAPYGAYDGEVAYSDEIVGRLIEGLKRRDLYDAATIVLLSDHGEGLGDHGEQEHGLFLYNESIRVPLIVKLPGGRSGGRRVDVPVQHVDLVPTLLDLTGAPPVQGLPGRSLTGLLLGSGEQPPDRLIYSEALYPRYHFGWSELYALTDSRHRFIRAPRDELYDLEQDPAERHDVSRQRARTVIALRAELDRLLGRAAVPDPGEIPREDLERLQALGYVGGGARVAGHVAGDKLPDPKDKVHVLERYRAATELAGARRYTAAASLFRSLLAEDPEMTDVWIQLAQVLVRNGDTVEAVEAYKRVIRLNPSDAGSLIGAAAGLLRLGRVDDARAHAELAVRVAPAGAHEILAKIALARRDQAAARRHADLAHEADPTLPLPIYVQALLLYNEGRYAEALPLLLETERQLAPRTLKLTELHFYIGDTLARLERHQEAEVEFQREIQLFPHNTRARASLAMLYRSIGRDADAERAIETMLAAVPTREGFDLAERLWTIFGEPARARAVRERARKVS
jgi:arylsulfatase A-like enzyme/Flp pilus assembly protein TadD